MSPRLSGSPLADLLLARAVPLLASTLTTFATAFLLAPKDRGSLTLVVSSANLVGAVAFLNLHVGIVHALRGGDRSAFRRGLLRAGAIGLGLSSLGCIAWLLLSAGSSVGVGGFSPAAIAAIGFGAGLVVVNLVVLRTVQGLGGNRVFRNAWLIQAVMQAGVGVPVAWLTRATAPVIVVWCAAVGCSTLYAIVRRPRPDVKRGGHTQRLVRPSLPAHLGAAGQQMLHGADVLVVGALTDDRSVGVYSLAVAIVGLVWVVSEAVSLATFESLSRASSSEGSRLADRTATSTHRSRDAGRLGRRALVGGAVVGIAAFGLTVLALPIFLPAYSGAVLLVAILLPGVVAQGHARVLLATFSAGRRHGSSMLVGASSAGLSVLYLPFVAAGGPVGAAIGSSSLYLLQTGIVVGLARMERSRDLDARSTLDCERPAA